MADINYDESSNITTFTINDAGAFHCFQQGINDRRHWNRHEETRKLQDVCVNNTNHSNIIVKYNDSFVSLKKIN